MLTMVIFPTTKRTRNLAASTFVFSLFSSLLFSHVVVCFQTPPASSTSSSSSSSTSFSLTRQRQDSRGEKTSPFTKRSSFITAAMATTSMRSTTTKESETPSAATESSSSSEVSSTDSLVHPPYEIEKIPIRIGHGFDIHRMVPLEEAGQPVVIGGVQIPHKPLKWKDMDGKYSASPGDIFETELGVAAHSDGDVIYHSLVDAIFGALTLPDIGQIFQDTDPRWKGCDSSKFMEYAYEIMSEYSYQIGNIDVTLILERPKVASFKPAMKENIVRLLHTTPGRVNIKARTHEKVDSVGELRSLSCHVVITLERIGQ